MYIPFFFTHCSPCQDLTDKTLRTVTVILLLALAQLLCKLSEKSFVSNTKGDEKHGVYCTVRPLGTQLAFVGQFGLCVLTPNCSATVILVLLLRSTTCFKRNVLFNPRHFFHFLKYVPKVTVDWGTGGCLMGLLNSLIFPRVSCVCRTLGYFCFLIP